MSGKAVHVPEMSLRGGVKRHWRQSYAAPALILVLALVGCGDGSSPGDAPPPGTGETPVAAAAAVAVPASTEAAPPVSLTVRQALAAVDYAFPHSKHVGVDCQRCHTRPKSHVTHPDAPCTACHTRPAVLATLPRPQTAECMSCHHANRPDRACSRCHESAPSEPIPERLTVVTAAGKAPRARTVMFVHARHSSRACTECHTTPVTRAFGPGCGSCHESHHRPEAECATCHDGRGIPAHTDRAHQGCAGAECHQDATVLKLSPTRNVCLICHETRQDHFPGRQCTECHIGFGPTIRTARRDR